MRVEHKKVGVSEIHQSSQVSTEREREVLVASVRLLS